MVALSMTEFGRVDERSSSDWPLVSVVLPFADMPPDFLREAVESVFQQTLTRWELLLVDDCTGGSDSAAVREVAREMAARHPERVRVIRHPEGGGRGPSAARNCGLDQARGELVAFLDADDVWRPSKLEEQVGILREHPLVGMLYGSSLYWFSWRDQEEETPADFVPPLGVPSDTPLPEPGPLPRQITGRAAVPCPSSVLVRRRVALDVGGFEGWFRGLYEDQVFFAKMCLAAPVLASETQWDLYRQHHTSFTGRTSRAAERESRKAFLDWLEDYAEEVGSDGELARALRLERWKMSWPRLWRFLRLGKKAVERVAGRRSSSAAARPTEAG